MKSLVPPILLVGGLLWARSALPGAMTAEELEKLPGLNKMVWLRLPPAKSPPTIDGTLDLAKGEWADAACIPGMLDQRPALLIPIPSRTYITWDKEHFYIGVRTTLLPGQRLLRNHRSDEEQVHADDAIELFLDPLGRDQPERAHFQVIFNSLGYCWDAMHSVGVVARYWDGHWVMKSDYQVGMDHFDAEVAIPVKTMRITRPNASGDCWRFLVCRDWKWLDGRWNIYSSLTGWGGFPYPESYGGLVLDEAAPVVQVLDVADLWQGKLGLAARLANPGSKPIECVATVKVFPKDAKLGDKAADWSSRPNPLVTESKSFALKPGEEAQWQLPAKDLPPLDVSKDKDGWYDLVLTVGSADGKKVFYRRQAHFRSREFKAKDRPYSLPMSVQYNPVRQNLLVRCDVLDDPNREAARGVVVELLKPGGGKPLLSRKVSHLHNGLFTELVQLPELAVGKYPVRATLVGDGDKPLASKDLEIERLDEAKEFKWFGCKAGIVDKPIPPHREMQYRDGKVVTTMGEFAFAGSGLPSQIRMTGEDLLAAPVRLTCSVGGNDVRFRSRSSARFGERSAIQADLAGSLESENLTLRIANHMEYDGCMRVTLDVEPKGEVAVDHLRLEVPFKPERADWLWTMARAGRESWVAADLSKGEGVVWDSRNCRGHGMTVGTFMPQYVVSDSLRGLCWFADNDKGWVPTDDVPATEVVREKGETVVRFNLIGKPFTLRGKRQIEFYLLGLPGRPLPEGARIYHRVADNFGHYVGNKILNYSAPMPRDFAKAREFMAEGTLYEKDGAEKHHSGKWHPDHEFAPWHDSHTWFRTPDIHPATFTYFALECGDGSWTPTMLDYKCYLWNEYVRQTPLAGCYFDTPEACGFSRNLSNGTAYVIPEGQPCGGQVQPGYRIAGFREYVKRVRGVFFQHGRENPWLEMHSTHGPIAPCTAFLDIRTDGENYRTPTYRHFMNAWSVPHLRAIDVPPLYGIVTRWLGGYPWDGSVKGTDPLRCKIGALIVHDIFTGWGDFDQSTTIYKNQAASTRGPLFGFKRPHMTQALIAHGLNRADTVYHPYWKNADVLAVTGADGEPVDGVRASLWHVPSQHKAVVAVANWNERPVQRLAVKISLDKLDLAPAASGENFLVLDLETGEVLQETTHRSMGKLYFARSSKSRVLGQVEVSLDPLDFRLLLFARQ